MKKIKKNSESWDMKLVYKLLVPLVFLAVITLTMCIIITLFNNQYQRDK